jgi:opacity protein-like surface antigen
MVKKLLSVAIIATMILSVNSSIYAQDKPFRFGARGSFNLTTTSEDYEDVEDTEKKMRSTFGLGLFMDYYLSQLLILQVNALYNNKGVKFERSESGIGFSYQQTATEKLAYLSIPVMLRYALSRGQGVVPYLIAGPELGILLSAKVKIEASGDAGSGEEEVDVKDEVKSTEFVLNFGGGIEIPLESVILFLEARYGFGLTNIYEEVNGTEFDAKSRGIFLTLGAALP